jgi:DNA-binding NarL/FixJ family response regulator
MEIRPDADPLGGKQLEIYQRQMLVDSLLKDGKQQKEIAVRLGWNAATISRDVDALKKKSGLA